MTLSWEQNEAFEPIDTHGKHIDACRNAGSLVHTADVDFELHL
jgi:hypothetical protein